MRRLTESYRTTAWLRVQAAAELAEERAQLAPGRHVGTHTLRHRYTRHLLKNGTPPNYLSRWLGHFDIKTTPIYLELAPDPTGNLLMVA